MQAPLLELLNLFIDKEYPKGNEDRGFAIVCLSVFITFLSSEESEYEIVLKKKA
jgi:hypothetical protein